jgi:hypothetical protein
MRRHHYFLSRKASNIACSSLPVSIPMHIALSGTLESKGTFLNTPLASMAFLYSTEASALKGHAESLCCSDSSHRKCMFL